VTESVLTIPPSPANKTKLKIKKSPFGDFFIFLIL